MNYKDALRSYRTKRATSQCPRTQHKLYQYLGRLGDCSCCLSKWNYTYLHGDVQGVIPAGILQTAKVRAPSTQVTLRGLKKYTNYSILVFASTLKGDGNASDQIIVTTDEDSKLPKVEKTLNNAKEIAVVSILLPVM